MPPLLVNGGCLQLATQHFSLHNIYEPPQHTLSPAFAESATENTLLHEVRGSLLVHTRRCSFTLPRNWRSSLLFFPFMRARYGTLSTLSCTSPLWFINACFHIREEVNPHDGMCCVTALTVRRFVAGDENVRCGVVGLWKPGRQTFAPIRVMFSAWLAISSVYRMSALELRAHVSVSLPSLSFFRFHQHYFLNKPRILKMCPIVIFFDAWCCALLPSLTQVIRQFWRTQPPQILSSGNVSHTLPESVSLRFSFSAHRTARDDMCMKKQRQGAYQRPPTSCLSLSKTPCWILITSGILVAS
jgi:hypothetical protein